MRITEYKELNDGMDELTASSFWNDIEKFASYSFNASHAYAYTIISYWSMYLKVYYPQEFYAGSMTIVDDEAKLKLLVKDALDNGIRVVPPDINISTNRLEIIDDNTLIMPFQAVKGISSNIANYIMEAKRNHDGKFTSLNDFEKGLSAVGLLGKVNKRHRENMLKVGVFASLDPNEKPSTHPDRIKDRLELLPGFTIEKVKADRELNIESLAKVKILEIVNETRACDKCQLGGEPHPLPRLGKKAQFMVVFDSPTWKEGNEGKLLTGDMGIFMKAGLEDSGLNFTNGYFTSLVRSPKPKGVKMLTNDMINNCSCFLKREIEILKPAVIVAMGSNAVRYFCPDVKGTPAEIAGKVVYRSDLDASIVCGINPQQIIFDASKIQHLEKTFKAVADLVK